MSLLRRIAYSAGMMVRETGQALDRLGSRLQGAYAYTEQLSRHRQIMNLRSAKPLVSSDVFIAPNASVIGNVELRSASSIWYGAILRADTAPIVIAAAANVQDRAVLTGACFVGEQATIAPGAQLHNASVGAASRIGAAAVLEHGVVVGEAAYVLPGSVVPAGTKIDDAQIWAGRPAVLTGVVSEDMRAEFENAAREYVQLASAHALETGKTHEQIEGEKLRQMLMEERSEDYQSHMGLLGREVEIADKQATIVEQQRKQQANIGASA